MLCSLLSVPTLLSKVLLLVEEVSTFAPSSSFPSRRLRCRESKNSIHPMIRRLGGLLDLLKDLDRYLARLQPHTPQSPHPEGRCHQISKSEAVFGSSYKHPIRSIVTLQLNKIIVKAFQIDFILPLILFSIWRPLMDPAWATYHGLEA